MNETISAVPPVVKHLRLRLPMHDAFALFTREIGRWWPLGSHSCSLDREARLELDGRVGGEVVERTAHGRSFRWGTILEWEPPRHFAMTWHPGLDRKEATRVDVQFEPDGDGCALQLTHSGWEARGSAAASVRERYDHGWVTVIGRFVEFAEASA
jgi:uncharacterized protein YndB with AHSA1/START domain